MIGKGSHEFRQRLETVPAVQVCVQVPILLLTVFQLALIGQLFPRAASLAQPFATMIEVILVVHIFISLVLLAVTLVGMVGSCFGVARFPQKLTAFVTRLVKQSSNLGVLGVKK